MILITGATGNVGRQVVAQLLAAGQRVRAMSRDPDRAQLPDGVEVVRGDLRQPDTLGPALEGVERAFLFPISGHQQAFLEAGQARSLRRVVLLSSASAAAPDAGALGRVHADNEQVVRAAGIPWTFVRPGAFMVNDLRWAAQLRASDVVRGPYGGAATAPIDEKDIAAVVATALRHDGHEGQAYYLTGPTSLTATDRVAILGGVLGRPLRFEEVTAEQARSQMHATSPAIVDSLLAMMAARVGVPAPISDAVLRITGEAASPYRAWATRHAADFAPT